MEPEARLLRYFLAVAAELNFTRAAESLGIAQPALSAQIRQLEAQLGVRLLERTTRSVQLTDAGRLVQERGPAALAALAEVWDAARRAGRGESGRLRVAYTPSAGYETAPTLVSAVRGRYPGIEITAEVLPTPDIVPAVRDGRADVGVARMPQAADGVRLRTVRLEPLGALVPADHALAGRRDVDLAALAEHPILMHPRSANPVQFDFVRALFGRAGLEPRFVERPVAFDPTQSVIREGRAIGLIGASAADGHAAGLRWVPLANSEARLVMQLVVREGDISPAADRFERVAVATAAAAGWTRASATLSRSPPPRASPPDAVASRSSRLSSPATASSPATSATSCTPTCTTTTPAWTPACPRRESSSSAGSCNTPRPLCFRWRSSTAPTSPRLSAPCGTASSCSTATSSCSAA